MCRPSRYLASQFSIIEKKYFILHGPTVPDRILVRAASKVVRVEVHRENMDTWRVVAVDQVGVLIMEIHDLDITGFQLQPVSSRDLQEKTSHY